MPPPDLAWHYLDHSPQRWLFVLDHADDGGLPQEPGWLRSNARGTVRVTSRNGTRAAWGAAALHSLDVLELPFAVDLLLDLNVDAGDLQALEHLRKHSPATHSHWSWPAASSGSRSSTQ